MEFQEGGTQLEDVDANQVKLVLSYFGNQIAKIRSEQGLSQEQLADLVSIAPSRISKMEHGQVNSKLTTLVALSNALHVTVDELVRKPEPDDGVYLLVFRPLLGQFTRRELLVLYDILKAAQASLELYRNRI